jgi:haloacetate dehalogenase
VFEGFEERFVDVAADVRIHCVTAGSGPPVLLLHGYPQTLAVWAGVAPVLAERFTVVCADLRGYGDSSKPPGVADSSNYSFRVMAGDQVTLMHRLGFDRFHLVGHDRGARCGHRLALDQPGRLASLAVLDIAPTQTMFTDTNRHVAAAYWHWYFLSLPAPFPERMIGADPDFFFETCFETWGRMPIADVPADALAEYRRGWRDPAMIHASCCDYRAAPTVDLGHDEADTGRTVDCPVLALWGSEGFMHRYFDLAALWGARCSQLRTATLPGGHFFVDQFPAETAGILAEFLGS